jgi:hypothetical protein
MTKRKLTNTAVLALTLCLSGPGAAQTFQYQTINIKGSASTYVTGINDSGVVVANYTDTAGTTHCATISGRTITKLADPNEIGTGPGKGTACYAINNAGQVVGWYSQPTQVSGFLYSSGAYTDIIVPTTNGYTVAYGMNNSGDIVGTFTDAFGQHGFLYNGSVYQTLDVPGASFTLGIGINDGGEISLEWLGTDGKFQSATLLGTTYTTLNVPGDTQSEAGAIDNRGEIVYAGQDAGGAWHGYLYQSGIFTQFDIPGANYIRPRGINSAREIVGWYNPGTSTLPVGFKGNVSQIAAVSPNSGKVGQTLRVTIIGSHTHFVQGSTQASFGAGISVGGAADGQPGPVTVTSPTRATAHLVISATATPGSQTVTATTGTEQAVLVNGFSVVSASQR